MKSIWIARDKDSSLYVYERRPVRSNYGDYWDVVNISDSFCELESYWFPELTWESEPIELVIKEKEN